MTNNKYHLNLIRLIYLAFVVLDTNIPNVYNYNDNYSSDSDDDYDDYKGASSDRRWYKQRYEKSQYAKLSDRFCIEIIGALQNQLPPRIQQLIKPGFSHVCYGTKTVTRRPIDIDGIEFRGRPGSGDPICGFDSFYDDGGRRGVGWSDGISSLRRSCGMFLDTYLYHYPGFIEPRSTSHRCLIM